jgi:hypothetical protein
MFETFDIDTAGYFLMRGQMPRCEPAPGNRFKFAFPDTAVQWPPSLMPRRSSRGWPPPRKTSLPN